MAQVTTVSTFQGQMRTVTHQSVLYAVAKRMGLDPANNLETNTATALLEYIDQRTRESWELWDWSEFLIKEQRAFANAWIQSSTYITGQIVFDWTTGTLAYYQAAQNVPAGTLLTNTAFWTVGPILPLPLTVPTYGQIGSDSNNSVIMLPEVGTVFDVTGNDPYQNQVPFPIPFTRSALGITIFPQYTTYAQTPIVTAGGAVSYPYLNLNTIFILHRQAYPGFATEQWVNGQNYFPGNLVYFSTDTYVCLQSTSSDQPTNPSFWQLQPFPYILSEFVKQAAYCDALEEDGQQEKAQTRLPNAYSRLFNEFDKQTIQQGLTQRYSVMISPSGH